MRLIDADKLEPTEKYVGNHEFAMMVYMDDIDYMPTIDAVEVVRCKNCVYWGEHYEQGCGMADYKTEPNHFCGWGKRKTE